MIMIFLSRFFIEFLKNVQVQSEIVMRENTGLILGQWLSIPFVIWGVWLIWNSMRKANKEQVVVAEKEKQKSNFITKK